MKQEKMTIPPPPAMPEAKAVAGGIPCDDGTDKHGHRIVIYGAGGIGKTTLACRLPGPVAVIDLEDSLGRLHANLSAQGLAGNYRRVKVAAEWGALIDILRSPGWDGFGSVVIDSGTRAEALCLAWMLEHVPVDSGRNGAVKAESIEAYGYGKGYAVEEQTFKALLAALDRHVLAGRNVCLVCHDCESVVHNPDGSDWKRIEPRLMTTPKCSIRLDVKEWCDHLLYINYDVAVDKHGKATGAGTKTVYTSERPGYMAKSRTTQEPIPLDDSFSWNMIIK